MTVVYAQAHPRSRGENLSIERQEAQTHGLIPAHAGKTCPFTFAQSSGAAHPRSRGENRGLGVAGLGVHGSSPLTRGKHLFIGAAFAKRGLIPAHAGKTDIDGLRLSHLQAHPRSRGENGDFGPGEAACRGSSPLTRGKLDECLHRRAAQGLIPAHAGKTRQRRGGAWPRRAHPRSRGENAQVGIEPPGGAGSSPLTRGKLLTAPADPGYVGLIPAHAGKTTPQSTGWPDPRAHPRSRGENVACLYVARTQAGSSPLTRGKRSRQCPDRRQGGLIPAHAGKTPSTGACQGRWRAHPRSRGENRRRTKSLRS